MLTKQPLELNLPCPRVFLYKYFKAFNTYKQHQCIFIPLGPHDMID